MTEQLTIFGKEFSLIRPGLWMAWCGLLTFSILLEDDGVFRGFINGDAKTGESGCATREAARDALESEGRRIAREMITMAGEMVAWSKEPFGMPGQYLYRTQRVDFADKRF